MPSVLDETLKKHRRRLIEREEAAFRELLEAYSVIERDLKRQVEELQKQMIDAKAAGENISPSWLFRERRLKTLIDQVKQQIVRFGDTATRITEREQRAAIRIAAEQTGEMFRIVGSGQSAVGSLGTTLPTRAVEDAVGMMGDGSPILEYYRENLAPKVAEMIRSEVIKAVARGTDFRTVANRLLQTGQITRSRALMVARTEVNRVRRETTRQIYLENSDVITGWEWVASSSPRTCAACLSLDGQIFKLNRPFPAHNNCRCTMIAVIDGVDRPQRILGSEWFDDQPDDIKEKIIGKDGLAAYKDGLVDLKDFRKWANHKQFGRSVRQKPLSEILAGKPIASPIIRTPRNIEVEFEPGADDLLQELLGRDLSPDDLGGLVGALDGAKVSVDFDYDSDGLRFNVSHPLVKTQIRTLSTDWAGRLQMHNEHFRKTVTAPKAIGLKSFATQVEHARRFGVEYIDTYAAGNYESSKKREGYNGYYTWPRFGYNAEITEADRAKFPVRFRNIRDLNELFLQVRGKFVWRRHGSGRDMLFDLDDDSRQSRILREYLLERGFTLDFD